MLLSKFLMKAYTCFLNTLFVAFLFVFVLETPAAALGAAAEGEDVYTLDSDGKLALSALSDTSAQVSAKSITLYDVYYANDGQSPLKLTGTSSQGSFDVVFAAVTNAPAPVQTPSPSAGASTLSTGTIAGIAVGACVAALVGAGLTFKFRDCKCCNGGTVIHFKGKTSVSTEPHTPDNK